MKDKTKKWLAITGLLAVCAVLVFGIGRVLYHEPDREAQAVERESEETELFVETEHRNLCRQKAQKQRRKSRL